MYRLISGMILLFFSGISFAQETDYYKKAATLVQQMTLEEKASLCSGRDFWSTKPVDRLHIPSIFMTDGPHGVRKAAGAGFTNSVPATCFPTASALASSWDTALVYQVGIALGEESQANDVQLLLGPGINMKRSPLGGRNFEYFSEDPVLSGKLAASIINGIQSQGVGTSLKHFAVNNQEFERMSVNAKVDERTLREIYLAAFEIAVKQAQPWTIMCAYNKLNDIYCSENKWLLDSVLRKQWGFKGFVISDWGAVNERPEGIEAGLALEMPGNGGINDKTIIDAVNNGSLSVERLDEVVTELLAVILRSKESHNNKASYDKQTHHDLARKVSSECIVLLKNEGNILPLEKSKYKHVALIGSFAKKPRYQGVGSSQINPTQLSNAYDELVKSTGSTYNFSFATGYDENSVTSDELIKEAVSAAAKSDVAVIFAGLPDSYESEGFDRKNMELPESHNRLIEAVAKVQPNVVVVLMNGSAVAMPWAKNVKGIMEGWLGGQAGGGALADVLTGNVNPSGKLSETFPAKLEDTPAYLDFPGMNGTAEYGERMFIGYRYYDKKQVTPLYPFGYGLSYTSFNYADLSVNYTQANDTDKIIVTVKVKNTGNRAGKEVVQLYIHNQDTAFIFPEKELKHFVKVDLKPGEERSIQFALNDRDFAYYDAQLHDWQTSAGSYTILAGSSSRNLPLQQNIIIKPSHKLYAPLTRNSLVKNFEHHPKGKAFYPQLINSRGGFDAGSEEGLTEQQKEAVRKSAAMIQMFMKEMPVYKLVKMSGGKFTEDMLARILAQVQ